MATFGERAVDVFYVTDLTGTRVTQPDRQAAIRSAVMEVFAGDVAALKAEGLEALVAAPPPPGSVTAGLISGAPGQISAPVPKAPSNPARRLNRDDEQRHAPGRPAPDHG